MSDFGETSDRQWGDVLGVLREVAPITVSHLATRLGISPPSASAIVDRMVDGGLVRL